MTRKLIPILLLISTLALAGTSAQESNAVERMELEDAAGDVEGVDSQEPFGFADIREFQFLGNTTTASISFQVAGDADASNLALSTEFVFEFEYQTEQFQWVIHQNDPLHMNVIGALSTATLWRLDNEWQLIDNLEAPAYEGLTYTSSLDWETIRTSEQYFPGPGEVITPRSIFSHWDNEPGDYKSPGGPLELIEAYDYVSIPADQLIILPSVATANIAFSTPNPVRYSNGEATTFHWPIQITNIGPTGIIEVSVIGPADFEFQAPPGFEFQEGGNRTLNVYATTPFRHEHGTTEQITVEIIHASQINLFQLGIHYPLIPQPAGHHPTLYLHGEPEDAGEAATDEGKGWMNTMEEDLASTAALYSPTTDPCVNFNESPQGLFWMFPLQPGLLIGLDARIDERAKFSGSLELQNAVLPEGRLLAQFLTYHENTDDPFQFSWFDYSSQSSITGEFEVPSQTGSAQIPFDLEVPIPEAYDWIEPGTDLNLALGVAFCPTSGTASTILPVDQSGLYIQAGAMLDVPLNEFHDVLDFSGQQLQLSTETAKVEARADQVVAWKIEYEAQTEGPFQLSIIGPNADLVESHAESGLSKNSGEFVVSMQIPVDAMDFDLFEATILLQDESDPIVSGALRLSVVVNSNAAETNYGEIIPENEETPFVGIGFSILVGALVRRKLD